MERIKTPEDLIPQSKLSALEELMSLGLDESVACEYLQIDKEKFKELSIAYPKYYSELIAQQQTPIIAALKSVVASLATDPDNAKWFLEKRASGFSAPNKRKENPTQIPVEEVTSEDNEVASALREKYEAELLLALSKKKHGQQTTTT